MSGFSEQLSQQASRPAHIIVFGNEKGGSGKSTSAMHAAIALLRLGYKVGTIDLDARQGTLTRYMKNRFDYVMRTGQQVPSTIHLAIERSNATDLEGRRKEERDFLRMAMAELKPVCDFIVMDTPGTDSHISRIGHALADTLITPMNDSLVDLDLIAHIDADSYDILQDSVYTKAVQAFRHAKQDRGDGDIDWIIMRNRLSHIDANNKQVIGGLLDKMAALYNFRVAPGFGERVIFRELFLKGLTLLDLEDQENGLTMSQIAARQEVRRLIDVIRPEKLHNESSPPDLKKAV